MRSLNKLSHGFLVIFALTMAAGCAHTQIPAPHERSEPLDPQDKLIVDKKLNDARYVSIEGFEHMKVGRALLERVEDYDSLQNLAAKKAFVEQFLKDAYALNDQVIVEAADKMTDEEISEFLSAPIPRENEYGEEEFDPNAEGDSPREKFVNAYRKHAADEFHRELAGFQSLNTEESVDRYWKELVSNIEESILTKGRAMRLVKTAPLVPFVYAWIWYHAETDDRSAHTPDFSERTVFYPEDAGPVLGGEDPSQIGDDWSLLRRYAPVVAQEKAEDPSYDPSIDRFGEVFMKGTSLEDAQPGVDTQKPSLYAYAEKKRIQGKVARQLVYTLWYPEHPKLHKFDPEAGPMEGWTFRITLDRHNDPAIYESVSNCGCYYKVFPTKNLENRAGEQYKEKLKGKSFYLENKIPGKIDVVLPEVVDQDQDPAARSVIYYTAGKHQFVTVRPATQMSEQDRAAPRETYRLLPYETLEKLPFGDHRASLFDENGLVRNAHRPECTLLAPSGLFHAGHPRQRGTQLIYFDQAEFDDSKLFETYLRLPTEAFAK